MPLALLAIFLGYAFIYEAIHKESPWSEIMAAFGGKKTYMQGYDSHGQLPGGPPPPPGGGGGGGTDVREITKRFEAAVSEHFPELQFEGDFACRGQRGQYGNACTWSQHAFGNAVDYRCPDKDTEDRFQAWVHANWHIFNIAHFIPDEPGPLLTHTDFLPQGTGCPACNQDPDCIPPGCHHK